MYFKDISMERVSDETDLLIIGGGPAGMSAAIRAKQIANEMGKVSLNVLKVNLMSYVERGYLFFL